MIDDRNTPIFAIKTSVQGYGGGEAGQNSTMGLCVSQNNRDFVVQMRCRATKDNFEVDVSLVEIRDGVTKGFSKLVDLTSLVPQKMELSRDENGREYRLNLFPKIVHIPLPRQFKEAELRLEQWSINSADVFVNDQDYVGRTGGGSGGNIAFLDIPGRAKIEFSLLPLKEAEPEGILKDGVLNIKHVDGTTVRINRVRNGKADEVLSGGPYQVWVRWTRPTKTLAEYKDSLVKELEHMREKIAKGELKIAPETINKIERTLATDRVMGIASGWRNARPGEIQLERQE